MYPGYWDEYNRDCPDPKCCPQPVVIKPKSVIWCLTPECQIKLDVLDLCPQCKIKPGLYKTTNA